MKHILNRVIEKFYPPGESRPVIKTGIVETFTDPNDERNPFNLPREMRHRYGPCKGCNAPENKWCEDDCRLLDPMDYR